MNNILNPQTLQVFSIPEKAFSGKFWLSIEVLSQGSVAGKYLSRFPDC